MHWGHYSFIAYSLCSIPNTVSFDKESILSIVDDGCLNIFNFSKLIMREVTNLLFEFALSQFLSLVAQIFTLIL